MEKIIQWHIILSILCCGCFFNSLKNGLVHDDVFAIQTNADVRSDTPIGNIFINDFWGRNLKDAKSHKSFRPLCTLTFRINYLLHGLKPFGYHLVNLLLHTAVVNLFFYILYDVLFQEVSSAVIASLIFATHPVHVEAVTGVVGRADVLSCLLFLLSFLSYARHLHSTNHLGNKSNGSLFTKEFCMTILYGSMCLFVKEHSVTVFGVCVAYDLIKNKHLILRYLPVKSKISTRSNTHYLVQEITIIAKRVIFLMLWVFTLFIIRLQLMGTRLPTFKEEDNPASFSQYPMTRVMTYLYLLSFNAQLLLAPYVLCYDWQVGSIPLVENITDIRNIYTLCFLIVVASVALKSLLRSIQNKGDDVTLVGLALAIIPFIPASNFFLRVGFVVAERILYIPSLGFSILVAVGMVKMNSFYSRSGHLVYGIFVVLLVLFSWKTISYNTVWESRETLFKSGVVTLPHNAKAHYNYANYLKDDNRTKEAINHYKSAVKLYPSHSSAHNNLGTLLDDNQLAEYHFKEAIKHTPGHYRAMFNLAGIYMRQGRSVEAEEILRRCLGYSPEYYDAKLLFADVLRQNKKLDEAHSMYKVLLSKHASKVDFVHKYGTFLNDIGETKQAIATYEVLLKKTPNDYVSAYNLAMIYGQHGHLEKAIRLYERAISIDASDTRAYQSMAVLYYNAGKLTDANVVYERMFKSTRPTREHIRNHAVILFGLKHHTHAIETIEDLIKQDKYFLQAHYTIINFMVEIGEPNKTHHVIERALKLFPRNVEVLLQRGNLKRTLKQFDEAKKVYLEILSIAPNHFHSLVNLGTIYHIQNDLENTEKYYELAHKIDLKDSALIENIKKLRRLQARKSQT